MLPAKYSWGELLGKQASQCSATVFPSSGIVGPKETVQMSVEFTVHTESELTDAALLCSVTSMEEPLVLEIFAKASGLHVTFSVPSDSPELECQDPSKLLLDFGTQLLNSKVKQQLIITNHTAIPAPFSVEAEYFCGCLPTPPADSAGSSRIALRTSLVRKPLSNILASKVESRRQQELEAALLSHGKGAVFFIEPSTGTLGPFQKQTIEITAIANMWGEYWDNLICRAGELDPVTIPVQISVKGCPLYFQMTGPQRDSHSHGPILRFGTHISGGDTVSRSLRINNPSPYTIRMDWETLNQEKGDSKLVDLLVSYGDAFPLKDADGNEVIGGRVGSCESRKQKWDWDTLPSTAGTSSSSMRTDCEEEEEEEEEGEEDELEDVNKAPLKKIISVNLQAHEGTVSDYPYCITPRQINQHAEPVTAARTRTSTQSLLLQPEPEPARRACYCSRNQNQHAEPVTAAGTRTSTQSLLLQPEPEPARRACYCSRNQNQHAACYCSRNQNQHAEAVISWENSSNVLVVDGIEMTTLLVHFLVPGGGSATLHVSFTPLTLSEIVSETECAGFALGFLSLDSKVAGCIPGKVERAQGYELEPLRLDLHAFVKPALLTLELEDEEEEEEGLVFYASASDLIQRDPHTKILLQSVTTRRLRLLNSTETPLYFRLLVPEPFSVLHVEPRASMETSHSDRVEEGGLVLHPQHSMQVTVAFQTSLTLLTYQNQPENQLPRGAEIIQSERGERKLRFSQQLVVEYSNKSAQLVPLCAHLTVPVLQLSSHVLDFGTCYVGQTRVQEVFLSNTGGSNSYWTALIDHGETPGVFAVSPHSGTLDAHIVHVSASRVALQINFTAGDSTEYKAMLTVHGMLGEGPVTLEIRGRGSHDERFESLLTDTC
ncbi:deleted in lung and esophageal cancer protein 1-like [Polyodon spathula]|uniref:deleted in lung and esophageal cancer protein 1-like n=1 Tax=Polyodon spathula TaxID=7913 RepID=UPI001B7E3582|nr:deleted in lung and esophageal cancer protein 1-like [Polyodon spathula]